MTVHSNELILKYYITGMNKHSSKESQYIQIFRIVKSQYQSNRFQF